MLTLTNLRRHFRRIKDGIYYNIRGALTSKKRNYSGKTAVVANMAVWKRSTIESVLREEGICNFIYFNNRSSIAQLRNLVQNCEEAILIIWGMSKCAAAEELASEGQIPCWRMEDGFIRSIGLGATHILPSSVIIDKTGGIYFDASKPSQLETTLNNQNLSDEEHNFAQQCIDKVTSMGITKYNLHEASNLVSINSDQDNILVLGQCEDDVSILFGSPKIRSNTELIQLAITENPHSNIYFRPHPDVAAGLRKKYSDPSQFQDRITIIDGPFAMWENLTHFNRVYVMSSLGGFEAAIRGASVRVAGMPFYSGWGITDDYLTCERRTKKCTLTEIFYAAYIQAPTYIQSDTGERTDFATTINDIAEQKMKQL